MKTTMNQNLFKADNNNSIYIFKKIISEKKKKKLNQLNFETKDIFNVEEASKYLNLSKSTLYKLTSNKQIPHYKPTGKCIFFKKAELDGWIVSARVATDDEQKQAAHQYVSATRKHRR